MYVTHSPLPFSLFWLSIFPVDHVQSVELSIDVSNDSISATHGHVLGE